MPKTKSPYSTGCLVAVVLSVITFAIAVQGGALGALLWLCALFIPIALIGFIIGFVARRKR